MHAGDQFQQRRTQAQPACAAAAHQLGVVERGDDALHRGARQIHRLRDFAQAHTAGMLSQRVKNVCRAGDHLDTARFFILAAGWKFCHESSFSAALLYREKGTIYSMYHIAIQHIEM